MSDHLRFTPEEYKALTRACDTAPARGPARTFQQGLAGALRRDHPALADRIAALPAPLLDVLMEHLHDRDALARPEPARYELSYAEWRIVAQACAVVVLRTSDAASFRGSLLREIAEVEPLLAARLFRLDDEQFAAVCQEARSGKRRG